jgi:hypothetical protein
LNTLALGADDVAQVPVLERRVGLLADVVARDVDLDAPGLVLQRREAGLAHHALEHHAAGDPGDRALGHQLLRVLGAVGGMQLVGVRVGLEVVREGDALALALRLAQGLELLAAFGDQLVVVGLGGVGHGVGGDARAANPTF